MQYMYCTTIERRLPQTVTIQDRRVPARKARRRGKARARRHARIVFAFATLLLAVIGLMGGMVTIKTDVAAAETDFRIETAEAAAPETLSAPAEPNAGPVVLPPYTQGEAEALAKAMWGEARGCGDAGMAAVGWCALNRVDAPYWSDDLITVLSQPNQFCGYDPDYPVDPHILDIARDVLDRYYAEKEAGTRDPGRVLPENYYYFTGDGYLNYFRIEYQDTGVYWDWSLPSPYAN